MHRYALLFPTAPGKTVEDVKSISAYFRAHPDEHRESRRRLGITTERVFIQDSPAGPLTIAYTEGEGSFVDVIQKAVASPAELDREFLRLVAEIHGVDVRQPPAGPPPETIAEWADPDVSVRRRGIAFTAPALPGKLDAARAWAREAFVTRRQEHVASRRALGINVEVVTVHQTPMGDFWAVYLEGKDPVEANRRFAASREAYAIWFKDSLKPLVPPEIDFNQPVPPVEQVFDFVAEPVPA